MSLRTKALGSNHFSPTLSHASNVNCRFLLPFETFFASDDFNLSFDTSNFKTFLHLRWSKTILLDSEVDIVKFAKLKVSNRAEGALFISMFEAVENSTLSSPVTKQTYSVSISSPPLKHCTLADTMVEGILTNIFATCRHPFLYIIAGAYT